MPSKPQVPTVPKLATPITACTPFSPSDATSGPPESPLQLFFSATPGTNHILGDFLSFAGIFVVALGVGGHCDVGLPQDVGDDAPIAERAPAGHSGRYSDESGTPVGWKAGRAHFVGESDWVCQSKDGKVVIACLVIEIGVVDDLCDIDPVELLVSDIVPSKEYANTGCSYSYSGCSFIYSAMGSGEYVGVRDEGSSARQLPEIQLHLPRVFMLLSLVATKYTVHGIAAPQLHTALASFLGHQLSCPAS